MIGYVPKGRVSLLCREANGDIAWEVKDKPNVITDEGLRRLFLGWAADASGNNNLSRYGLFLSPSLEPPLAGRYTLADDGSNTTLQPTPSFDWGTFTWTYSAVFGGANRRIGTIGIAATYPNAIGRMGPGYIFAYTLLSPYRQQTGSQTVEAVYRVTITPTF